MIKKYNQFIKGKVNENVEENENPSNDMDFEENENPSVESQGEEEGSEYVGQKMMQDLSDELDVNIDTDGSITYDGRKINFYSETEMFHIGKQKFETVDDVVSFLHNEDSNDVDDKVKEIQDDRALLNNEEDQDETKDEEAFESKSYKKSRFQSYKKK